MLIVPILGVLASCTLGEFFTLLPIGCFIENPGKIWPSRQLTEKKYCHGISNLLCKNANFKSIHTITYYRIYFNPNISRHNMFTHTQPHAVLLVLMNSFASGNGGIVNFHEFLSSFAQPI